MRYFRYVFIFLFAQTALACSPAPEYMQMTVDDFVDQADVVFIGSYKEHERDDPEWGDFVIKFNVAETIKGESVKSLTVRTPGSGAACGYDEIDFFEKSPYVLIFANKLGGVEYWSTNHLSGNKNFNSLVEAKDYLSSVKSHTENIGKHKTSVTPELPNKNNLEADVPKVIGPDSDPLDGFVGPTTPPPYDNSVKKIDKHEEKSWWRMFWDWITGLFSWS